MPSICHNVFVNELQIDDCMKKSKFSRGKGTGRMRSLLTTVVSKRWSVVIWYGNGSLGLAGAGPSTSALPSEVAEADLDWPSPLAGRVAGLDLDCSFFSWAFCSANAWLRTTKLCSASLHITASWAQASQNLSARGTLFAARIATQSTAVKKKSRKTSREQQWCNTVKSAVVSTAGERVGHVQLNKTHSGMISRLQWAILQMRMKQENPVLITETHQNESISGHRVSFRSLQTFLCPLYNDGMSEILWQYHNTVETWAKDYLKLVLIIPVESLRSTWQGNG